MPVSHKFKLTLLDAKISKVGSQQVERWEATSYANLIENSLVIHWCGQHTLPKMMLRSVSGKTTRCLATACQYIGEYCLVVVHVHTHSQTKEGSGMRFIHHRVLFAARQSASQLIVADNSFPSLMGDRRGLDMSYQSQPPHQEHSLEYHPPLHKYPILLCTVCDRQIWVSVKFTRNFPKTLKHKEREYILNLSEFQLSTHSSRKILTANSPPFSNICPRYARRGIPWIAHKAERYK